MKPKQTNNNARPSRHITMSVPDPLTVRQEESPEDQQRYDEEKRARKAQTSAAIWLNGITLVGVLVTILTLRGLHQTLVQTKTQFALDQRPYMTAEPLSFGELDTGKINESPVPGQPLVVNIKVENIGKSPARNVVTKRYVTFGTTAEMQLMAPREINTIRGTTIDFPGRPTTTTAISQRHPRENQTAIVPEQDLINWDGSYPIIVFGNIHYQDAFTNSYCLEFAAARLNASKAWLDVSGHNTTECSNP